MGQCHAMELFVGRWKVESGEGFDDFLKDRGVGLAARTLIKTSSSTITFAKESGDMWSMTQETFIAGKLVKTNKKVWKDGEEFTTLSSDDKEVRMTFKFANGVLHTKEKVTGGVESSITRRVEGDKMIMEGNVVGKDNKFRIIFAKQ